MQHTQYRLQSSESQKLHNWKLNLIYSAALDWEGHSSFSVFHNGDSSLFILPNYILTLENYITRAVTSLNNCHSKPFCNALWCLPKQAIWRLETELHVRTIGSYTIVWDILFSSASHYKSSSNTCWPKTSHVCFIYLFGSATGNLALTLKLRLWKLARVKSICIWLGCFV